MCLSGFDQFPSSVTSRWQMTRMDNVVRYRKHPIWKVARKITNRSSQTLTLLVLDLQEQRKLDHR